MHPLQIVFVCLTLLVGLYLSLQGVLWLVSTLTGRKIVYVPQGALKQQVRHTLEEREIADEETVEADKGLNEQTDSPDEADEQTENTDSRQTASESRLSDIEQLVERVQLDRSRETIIELLVRVGWSVSDIRAIIKGDNAVISGLVAKAKSKLDQPEEADQVEGNLGQIIAMIEDPCRPTRSVPVRAGPNGMRYILDEAGQPKLIEDGTSGNS